MEEDGKKNKEKRKNEEPGINMETDLKNDGVLPSNA